MASPNPSIERTSAGKLGAASHNIVPTLRVGMQPRTLQRPEQTTSQWAEAVTPSLNLGKRIS